MNDPGIIVATLAQFLPPAYALYLGDAVGALAVACTLATLFCSLVRPPSASAPSWWLVAYRGVSWAAGNLGWARSAVVPGMHRPVQEAALVSAKITAAAPQLAVVAEAPAIAGAIVAAEKVVDASTGVPVFGAGDKAR